MNINELYVEDCFVVVEKETGECLFGSRTFNSKGACKTAYNQAKRYNSWYYKDDKNLSQRFDDQDVFDIVPVKLTIGKDL